MGLLVFLVWFNVNAALLIRFTLLHSYGFRLYALLLAMPQAVILSIAKDQPQIERSFATLRITKRILLLTNRSILNYNA